MTTQFGKYKGFIKYFLFSLFIILLFFFLLEIDRNSMNQLFIRKLEEDKSYKIYAIIVTISYVIFIVMDLLYILLISCDKGFQEKIFRYIYIANNGYLIMGVLTWIISGNKMVIISSSISIGIFAVGTIIYIIAFKDDFMKLFECEFIGSLFGLIPDIWQLFFDSINHDCSCFKNSSNCFANAVHYIYTGILVVGFGISTIAYIGFVIILIILWCIFTLFVISIRACCRKCDCCDCSKKTASKNEAVINVNNNINNNNKDFQSQMEKLEKDSKKNNNEGNNNYDYNSKNVEDNSPTKNNISPMNNTNDITRGPRDNNEIKGDELNNNIVVPNNNNEV